MNEIVQNTVLISGGAGSMGQLVIDYINSRNDFSITASFTPDLSDLDFDGLTLYEERVTYKTNPNTDDTSGAMVKTTFTF